MLLNDFGYAGFRYDMVKGYSGKFTGIYNTATKPTYSVGEYLDGDVSKVKNWLESTKVSEEITSAAFDFPIRYVVRDAINGKWSNVKTDGLANDHSLQAVCHHLRRESRYRISLSQRTAGPYPQGYPGSQCIHPGILRIPMRILQALD